MIKSTLALLLVISSVVLGQRPARIGPDGKPLLNRPVLEECQKSKYVGYKITVSHPDSNFPKLSDILLNLPLLKIHCSVVK